MGITWKSPKPEPPPPAKPKRIYKDRLWKDLTYINLDQPGWLEIGHCLAVIAQYRKPVCSKTLDRWIDNGRFPPPDEVWKNHKRWHTCTIKAWLEANAEVFSALARMKAKITAKGNV